jgi:hypothetical protein
MEPPKRDRFNEQRMKNRAQKARDDADFNLKKKKKFKDSLKDLLKKILGLLLQLMMMILPYLKMIIPKICPGTPGCPPDTKTGTGDPTEIIFPLQEIAELPPPPPPPEEEEEEEEAEAPEPAEEETPEGAIIFRLTTQPEEDITFKLVSLSDYLEFSESTITFPVESWDTPVYVDYTTSLETTPEEDDTYEDLKSREDKVSEPIVKRKSIYKETQPTVEQLVAHKKILNAEIKKPVTFKERLQEIQRRASIREAAAQYGGETKLLEELVEPIYDDDFYKPYEPEVVPSIRIKIKHDEDDYRKPYEETVEPTYEDGYESDHETVVPMLGGEEDEEDEENSSEENSAILDKLDYNALTSEINSRNLSEDLKAEFTLQLYQDIDYEIELNIEIDSDIWTIEPNSLTFSNESAEQNSFFFSQIVYDSLKESYAQSKGEQLGEKYLNSAQKEYDEGMAEVEKEEEKAEEEAEAIYDKTYKESMNETNEKIQNAENILEELEGGAIPKTYYLNKFKNRTHKLK